MLDTPRVHPAPACSRELTTFADKPVGSKQREVAQVADIRMSRRAREKDPSIKTCLCRLVSIKESESLFKTSFLDAPHTWREKKKKGGLLQSQHGRLIREQPEAMA